MAALIESGDVSFTYKDFVLPQHQPAAQWAAEAAHCAADQQKFWQYHGYLLSHQKSWTKDELKGYAKTLGLETQAFDQCVDAGKYAKEVQNSTAEAASLNLNSTPTFLINGRLARLNSYEQMGQLVRQELSNLK